MPDSSVTISAPAKPEPYDPMPRRIAQDENLLAESLGLIVYMNSLPSGWELRPEQVKKHFSWGKTTARRVMKNLVDAGYYVLHRDRNELGHVIGSRYLPTNQFGLTLVPIGDSTESPNYRQSVQPTVGKSASIDKTNNKNINNYKKDKPLPPPAKVETLHDNAHIVNNGSGGGRVFDKNVNLTFMTDSDQFAYRSRIVDTLNAYPEPERKMDLWKATFGDIAETEYEAVRSMWGQHGHVRCVAATVIVKEKVRKSRLQFFYQVLSDFADRKPASADRTTATVVPMKPLPLFAMTSNDGYLYETGVEWRIKNNLNSIDDFDLIGENPNTGETLYRLKDHASEQRSDHSAAKPRTTTAVRGGHPKSLSDVLPLATSNEAGSNEGVRDGLRTDQGKLRAVGS